MVEDRTNYVADGLTHLSDKEIYEETEGGDPTSQLARAINANAKTIHNKGYISDEMREYLHFKEPEQVRTQQLYFLKKLHKGPHQVKVSLSVHTTRPRHIKCSSSPHKGRPRGRTNTLYSHSSQGTDVNHPKKKTTLSLMETSTTK